MSRRYALPGLLLLTIMLSPGTTLAQSSTPDADEPIQRHLAWGLGLLDGGADDITVAEVEEHLDPTLLEHYPAEDFIEEFQQLSEVLGPLELVEDLSDPNSSEMFRGVFRSESGIEIMIMFQIDPGSGLVSNVDAAPVHESHMPATPAGTPAS